MTNKTPNKTKTPVGGLLLGSDPIEFNAGRKTITLKVRNTGDRPIQVGSHFHFFEVNRCLSFDREKAYGYHLDIPSGTSVRFEPGEEKEVQLTEMGGRKRVFGLNDLRTGGRRYESRITGKCEIKRISVRRDSKKFETNK